MATIKSITTVRVNGTANGSWSIRVRLTDGRELFYGLTTGLCLDQATTVMTHMPFAAGDDESILLTTFGTGFKDERRTYEFAELPAGSRVIA